MAPALAAILEHMFELGAVRSRLQAVLDQAAATGPGATLAQWVDVVEQAQQVVNIAAALQTVALAHVAAVEDVEAEDGTLTEQLRGLGHQRIDAPALVAQPLGLSAAAATARTAAAVDLVTRHPAVVQAMGEGRLDAYRASIVGDELADADSAVCAAVDDRLIGHLGTEPGPALRRRVRRALHVVAPDVLRLAGARARADRSLRRYPAAPGTDEWSARLPVEASRAAWSVIDDLARGHLRAGRSAGMEQGRADALMDLIHARATGAITVHLAVPASEVATHSQPHHRDEDMVPVTGFGLPGVTHVRRAWLTTLTGSLTTTAETPHEDDSEQRTTAPVRTADVQVVACHDDTGALRSRPVPTDPETLAGAARRATRRRTAGPPAPEPAEETGQGLATDSYEPPPWLVELVKARDGHCRFPGCSVNARFCDVDHVIPWPTGPTSATNLACLCRRHHRIKQSRRWHATLGPDASLAWTDPTGRRTTTTPQDFLHHERPHRPGQDPPTSPRLDGAVTPSEVASPSDATAPAEAPSDGGGDPAGPPELPSRLEEQQAYLIDAELIEDACRPRNLTPRNRRALLLGHPVNPGSTRAPRPEFPALARGAHDHPVGPPIPARLHPDYPAGHATRPSPLHRGLLRPKPPPHRDTEPPPF